MPQQSNKTKNAFLTNILKSVEAFPRKDDNLVVEAFPRKDDNLVAEAFPRKDDNLVVEAFPRKDDNLVVEAFPRKDDNLVVEADAGGSTNDPRSSEILAAITRSNETLKLILRGSLTERHPRRD